jgi:hypothetical protein
LQIKIYPLTFLLRIEEKLTVEFCDEEEGQGGISYRKMLAKTQIPRNDTDVKCYK